MSANSKIEWTDATWNPSLGCDKISPGCKNCYAIRSVHRMAGNPNAKIRAEKVKKPRISNKQMFDDIVVALSGNGLTSEVAYWLADLSIEVKRLKRQIKRQAAQLGHLTNEDLGRTDKRIGP